MVYGSVKMAPMMIIPRNMVILREEGHLTLINAVRLSDQGEKDLLSLGVIDNVVRISYFHAMDDAYYLDTYPNALYWSIEGVKPRHQEIVNHFICQGSMLPIEHARLFDFKGGPLSESILILEPQWTGDKGAVLISGDALLNLCNFDGMSYLGAIVSACFGFMTPIQPGPGWLMMQRKAQAKEGGLLTLDEDYARLLDDATWTFVLPAHGPPDLDGQARIRLLHSLNKTFGIERERRVLGKTRHCQPVWRFCMWMVAVALWCFIAHLYLSSAL